MTFEKEFADYVIEVTGYSLRKWNIFTGATNLTLSFLQVLQ